MSRLMEVKDQIEKLHAELERIRAEEKPAEIEDMRKRIIAFGIRPEDLFGPEDLKIGPEVARAAGPRKGPRAPRFRWNGKEWSGIGPLPAWFKEALQGGATEDQMRIKTASSEGE